MRVGIDATAIPRTRAGAGNYIFHLIRGISEADTSNSYVVFSRPQHVEEWGIRQPNIVFHETDLASRPLRLLWEQTILPILARHHRLDVLHSPHYTFPLFVPMRRVVTILDMTFFLYPELHSLAKRVFFRTMISLAARFADRLITISDSTATDLFRVLGSRALAEKTHPIPLAADPAYRPISDASAISSVCERFGLEPGRFILSVGVLEPRKNLPVLLRAYRGLRDEGVRHPLAIVGKRGWMFESIFSAVEELQLTHDVVFTGHVSDADLPYLYNGATVFVYPSIYEGFGLPVLEALACGTPVVTSNVSSLPEIVGEAGLLVDPHDPCALSAAIGRLLGDPNLARSLARRGRERAAGFSWQRTARETISVYERAVAAKNEPTLLTSGSADLASRRR